jgi:hypothetical protein
VYEEACHGWWLQFEAARVFLALLKLHPHKPVDVPVMAWRE